MTPTAMALMCIGLRPILTAPTKPAYHGGAPKGGDTVYQRSRKEVMEDRREAVFQYIKGAGKPVSRLEVQEHFDMTQNLAAKDIADLRARRLIVGSKIRDGNTWIYEARK